MGRHPWGTPALPSTPLFCPVRWEPLATRMCPEERGRPPAVLEPGVSVVPGGRRRAGNTGRGSCFPGDRAEGRIVSGREGAVPHGRGCVCITLPAQGGLFLNPKLRQQRHFCRAQVAQSFPVGCPGSADGPCLSQPLLGLWKHISVLRLEDKRRLRAVPFSPCLAGFLSQAVFPRTLAKVTAGLGAAGGQGLEIQRFLRHERLPKANNRGCRLLSLPSADSCWRWRQHGAPWYGSAWGTASGCSCRWPRCSDGTSAASELLIPRSWSGRARSPDFTHFPKIFGCTIQT